MSSPARSLRFKLTLWFVLVFFAIQAVLVVGVVALRRETIRQSLDDDLRASAEDMIENVLAARIDLREPGVRDLIPARSGFVMYALRDATGAILQEWNVPDTEELPFSAMEEVPQGMVGAVFRWIGPEQARTLSGRDDRLRLVTIPFRYGGRLYYFQAGVHDERLLGPFLDLVVVGMPVGVLAALVAAWVIAGRAVSPIHRLALAARKVSPTNLDQRFRVATRDEEIHGLEDELNSALGRIEAGYRTQGQFISNVSHELRTPIAVLLTEAQVTKIGEPSPEKAWRFVDRTEREMQRLARLVESFLLIARSDLSRHSPTDPVPVNDLVMDCVQHCRPLAREGNVRLITNLISTEDGSPEAVVRGDAELLQAMLENLVRNAIQHSPAEASVEVEAVRADDRVRITVRDHGPGIPKAYVERVFERFVQVPPESGAPAGAAEGSERGIGLGLAIATSVAQLHGGRVSVRSGDRGCVFEVVLPLARPMAEAGEARPNRAD